VNRFKPRSSEMNAGERTRGTFSADEMGEKIDDPTGKV
jgi:hypothetical protein